MALSDGCASRTMPIAFISLYVSTVLSILNTNGRFPVVLSGIIYAKYFCMAVSGYISLTVLFSASSSIVFFCFVLLLISASSFVFISFGRKVTLKVAVAPGLSSFLPPDKSTRSSSQVTL